MLVSVGWVVVIGVAGLAVGAFAGLAWTLGETCGQHSAYLPAFSVIARVRDSTAMDEEPCWPDEDDADAWEPDPARAYPLHSITPRTYDEADSPAVFRYDFGWPTADEADFEMTAPILPPGLSQAPDMRQARRIPSIPAQRTGRHALRTTGRHALREDRAELASAGAGWDAGA
ncbi:hypothetical protein AB0H34_21365 [Saccharopolyspora shandongensis]|uniref:hypothetical protein n=1 Tax=Saccharopolyspora shandongensis TaxID=418495 RepID=UPI00340B1B05